MCFGQPSIDLDSLRVTQALYVSRFLEEKCDCSSVDGLTVLLHYLECCVQSTRSRESQNRLVLMFE